MQLPFAYSYNIINNILTIVFDFSGLSCGEFNNLKPDYFQKGLVIDNQSFGFYMGWGERCMTYKIDTNRFGWNGESAIGLQLVGKKVAAHNKAKYNKIDNEHVINLFTAKHYQSNIDIIDTFQTVLRKRLNDLLIRQKEYKGTMLQKSDSRANRWSRVVSKDFTDQITKIKASIESNEDFKEHFISKQNKVSSPIAQASFLGCPTLG